MRIVGKEPQVERTNIKVSIHIEDRIVTHFCFILHTELRRSGVQERRIVGSKIPHIHPNLRIQRTKPSAVVIEVMIERYRRQRHVLRTRMLIHHMVLEVDPRRRNITLHIGGQHLYISIILIG